MQYVVQRGDTLISIARRFGTSVQAILTANPIIRDPNFIFVGQVIIIPTGGTTPPPPPPPTGVCPTLSIGSSGAAVRDLQTRLAAQGFSPGPIDGIFGPRTQAAVIAFQQSKNIPATGIVTAATWGALGVNCGVAPPPPPPPPPPSGGTYIVQPGDTMSAIARRFGVSLQALIAANPQITNPNVIFPGQTLNIPRA